MFCENLNNMKQAVKNFIRGMGYDLHKASSNPIFQLGQSLRVHDIDLILDIGANVGQFAKGLREIGYKGRIVSFEPLVDAHHILSQTARGATGWAVHERCAIGDRIGTTQINVSANSVSSSVLPMLQSHSEAAPKSVFTRTEETPIQTVDSIADRYMTASNLTLIKIDTQGFEWQVLDGAAETLKRAKGVMVELSLVQLYFGQRLWQDIIVRLETQGFDLWSLNPAFVDPQDGRMLQLDGLFFKKING